MSPGVANAIHEEAAPLAVLVSFSTPADTMCIYAKYWSPARHLNGPSWFSTIHLYQWQYLGASQRLKPIFMFADWGSKDQPESHQEEFSVAGIQFANESHGYENSTSETYLVDDTSRHGGVIYVWNGTTRPSMEGIFSVLMADSASIDEYAVEAYQECGNGPTGLYRTGPLPITVTSTTTSSSAWIIRPTDFHGTYSSHDATQATMLNVEAKAQVQRGMFASFFDGGRVRGGAAIEQSVLSWSGPGSAGVEPQATYLAHYLVDPVPNALFITGDPGEWAFRVHASKGFGASQVAAIVVDIDVPGT